MLISRFCSKSRNAHKKGLTNNVNAHVRLSVKFSSFSFKYSIDRPEISHLLFKHGKMFSANRKLFDKIHIHASEAQAYINIYRSYIFQNLNPQTYALK